VFSELEVAHPDNTELMALQKASHSYDARRKEQIMFLRKKKHKQFHRPF